MDPDPPPFPGTRMSLYDDDGNYWVYTPTGYVLGFSGESRGGIGMKLKLILKRFKRKLKEFWFSLYPFDTFQRSRKSYNIKIQSFKPDFQ